MRTIHLWLLMSAACAFCLPAAAQNGVEVTATGYGIAVESTSTDAIRVVDSGDDGLQIGNTPNYPSYGVYIPSPGVTTYGLWSNTANALGEWALYTVDKIEAGNVAVASMALVAKVEDSAGLEPGEIVSAAGLGAANEDYPAATVSVRRATAEVEGIVGVVQSRMHWVAHADKPGERSLESAPGAAEPGDFVLITVLGVQRVRIDAGTPIKLGQRLTVGAVDGRARSLRTRRVDGFVLTEGTPTLGVALENTSGFEESVLAFVSLR